MADIDEDKIRKLIEALDHSVPREGGRVKMSEYGGGKDESMIIANRTGYLRFGIEFLKCAFAGPTKDANENNNYIEADIQYLVTKDSTVNFDWFERREDVKLETMKASKENLLLKIGGTAIAIIVLIMILIGFVTTIKWIF